MASTIINDGAFYPASTTIVLRANSAGNPIFHNEVDGNFENLRLAHNQVVTELATKSIIGHVHSVVTTSVNGFMSSADKAKLDGVASGANNYALPTATSSTKGGVKVGSNLNISNDAINVPGGTPSTYGVVKYDDSTIKINGSNQLYVVDDGHAALTSNPHNVTASQLGLGSVVSDIAGIQVDIGSRTSGNYLPDATVWETIYNVENTAKAIGSSLEGQISGLSNSPTISSPNFTGTVDIGNSFYDQKAQILIGRGASEALTIIPYWNDGAVSHGTTKFKACDIEVDGSLDVGGGLISGPLTIHSQRTFSSSSPGGGGTGGGSSSSNGLVVNGGAKIDGNLEVTGNITANLDSKFASFLSPSICTNGFTNALGTAGKLKFYHDNDWMNPYFNGLSIDPITKEIYERYYWHRNSGREGIYRRSNNTFYNPHGYSSPSAVKWESNASISFSTTNVSAGLVNI